MINAAKYERKIDDAISYASTGEYVTDYNWTEALKERTIIAFGLGKFMQDSHERLFNSLTVSYVCDNDSAKWGEFFYGKKCLAPNEIGSIKNAFVILVMGGTNVLAVMEQLDKLEVPYMPITELHFSAYEKGYDSTWLTDDAEKIRGVLPLLVDDVSRSVYTDVFCNKAYLSCNYRKYSDFACGGEYFENGLWTLGVDESFVDGGAYIGDTIDDFIEKTNGAFKAIYSFEYESKNYRDLCKRITDKYPVFDSKIQLFNCGIFDRRMGGYAVHFGESDGTELVSGNMPDAEAVQLMPLDEVLDGEKITAIKFDIEGAEINGLRGAKGIIQEQKPKLAICLYHRPEDLWEIPLYIHKLNPRYRMVIKHHSYTNYTDTVLYAADC